MSRTVDHTDSITANPSGYINQATASVSNVENAYADSTNTTYGTINLTTGSNAETIFYYTFDLSAIPSGATINSVTCKAKVYISSTSTTYIASRAMQMYAGTTAKGSATSPTTTATEYTMSVGSWTRAELLNARIRLYAKRTTSSTSTSRYFRFYGATLTVSYTWQEVLYTITASSSVSGVSVTPASQEVQSGASCSISVLFDNLSPYKIVDNGVAKAGAISYSLSNVTADHTISIVSAIEYMTTLTSADITPNPVNINSTCKIAVGFTEQELVSNYYFSDLYLGEV